MARIKKWRSKEIVQKVSENVSKAMGEIALRAEGHSKRELRKGHGVVSGTLRRSIHTAQPGYDWSKDGASVTIKGKRAKGSSFTLGGKLIDALIESKKITIQLGSGLGYALPVHQGHHSFSGYHYLTNGVDKAKPELPAVLKKHELR